MTRTAVLAAARMTRKSGPVSVSMVYVSIGSPFGTNSAQTMSIRTTHAQDATARNDLVIGKA